MAHNIFIKPVPHVNQDGHPSQKKMDYMVIDRCRGKRIIVGVCSSHTAAESLMQEYRAKVVENHLRQHPHDHEFKAKHRIGEND